MTRKQIGAVLGAVVLAVIAPLLILALLHGAGGTAQANGPPDPYSKDSMPDFGQHSKSWCWVGAASNSFWWFAQTGGYPELMNPGDEFIEPLSRDATPAAPDLYDPHDLDGDTVTNEPDGVPDWFDYNDRPEGTGLIYDGTCGDYADNDGDTLFDFTGRIFFPGPPPPAGPRPPDPDCTSFAAPLGDDDSDGMVDEDPINGGVDEDGDSLVDEDPIDIPPFDDDGDTLFDEDPPAYDDDGNNGADEDGVVGYRTLLKKVAETVWRDTNQNGIRDPNERNYAYSEAVEKWDYLCGLQKYIDDHGAALQVHDLLHPNYTGKGITPPTDENRGAMSWSRPSQLTAQAAQNCGVSQVVRIPTLDDYKTELARSQDVLVWMCRQNAQGDYYCHVVTGQSYDTTVGGAHGNGIITVSDPWTHNANLHDDGWLNKGTGPDHNNDYKHSDLAYPGEDPYDDCDVFTPGSNAPAQDFVIDCGLTRWTVIDLIFISPEGPDVKVVDWWAPSPIEIMTVPGGETILVEEIKHNNGPGDPVTASATWTAISSDPAGLGVTWVPKPGDIPGPGVLEFEVDLNVSAVVPLDRYLELEGLSAGQYSVTLINEEWPLDGYDRDPSNNVATTTIFVNVGTTGGIVDKEVQDIVFDDGYSYPDEGADIGNEWWINKSENVPFSITSEDINWGPDEPVDAEISFYMDVPAGCSARWYDPQNNFPFDIETIGGSEHVGSSGTPWFPPAKEAGPVMLDLHFQTAEYPGLYEPVGDPQRYTRFFEIHCWEAGDYVFRFCNRADVKYDYDPYPDNNLLCEDLTIHSLHNADIKVLTFYSDPAPEGPFTFDVSTYNVIDLIEDKHNNGPQDAWSSVWWSMDPIEDRDGDGIPDINVRWEAQIGDLCTYQGLPVPCGEGDGVGTGGSGDGLPSLTGDNCQDDFDNDGDGTCDINGCTAFPGIGDPDCKVDIDDIQFAVWLPVSADDMVSRPLKLHCKPRSDPYPYTLTLYNEEWPFNPEDPGEEWVDPEPENNFQQLDIDVTCQVADPHYKCYDIYDPDAPAAGELVTLEDQFHTQTGVEVTDARLLCPPAIKYVDGEYAGGGTAAPHLKCYRIVGMPDADATVNLTTQFGTETDVEVGFVLGLCVPALKAIAPDPPQGDLPTEPHYVCYDIVGDAPPPGLTIDLETQFGTEYDLALGSWGWLCAPAIKYDDVTGEYLGGNLDAPHLRCYPLLTGSNPPHIVNLQTQFPLETDVEVNHAVLMCVPAEKEIVVPDEADVKIVSQEILNATCDGPPPTDIDVSVDEVICVRKVLHNNGPYGPVSVDIDKTASAPPGCTILPLNPTFQVVLPVSLEGVVHDEWFTIHCDEASTHGPFTIDNDISIKDPGITDPDPLNNTASSTMDVNAWATADIQIVGQQILAANCLDPAPTEINLSEDVTICVHKLLHNDGPYAAQPVHVDVTKTAWASAGATILPPTHTEQVGLYFSDVVPHVEYFTIHCYEPSTHEFRVDNDVTVKDEHVIDPDGASASSSIFVDCLASTDIKITSQSFLDPPAQMTVGVPEIVTLRKQLHNNGGYGPAMVDIDKTAYTNSPDATIAPPSASAQVDLPVSSPVIHDEDFTLSCSAPGIYTYTVENDVTSKEPHISGGDFESTDLIVECVEGAQEIKWAQMPDESPDGLDVSAYEPFVLAEDFQCTQSGLITEIDFWASWLWDEPPGGDPGMVAFILSLHSDVPAGVDLPWSHPGEMLWTYTFDPYECTAELWGIGEEGWLEPPETYEPWADTEIWLYSCPIPEPYWFQQEKDTIYWLDVQAIPMGPEMFGWKTSFEHWNDDGTWAMGAEPIPPLDWSELRYPPGHPLFPESIDLAFQIWGQECDPLLDSDGDGFNDAVECYLPTDRSDDCTDVPGVHDAWPLDVNMDTWVTVSGDVFPYRGRIGAWGGPPADPNWLQRLDLNADNWITVSGDVFPFRGKIGDQCT